MAEPGDDEINGEPGVMMTMAGPTGNLGKVVNSATDLVSDMEEGKAFITRDRDATKELTTFVTATNRGFEAYAYRAHQTGHDYLGTDIGAADTIEDITRNIV